MAALAAICSGRQSEDSRSVPHGRFSGLKDKTGYNRADNSLSKLVSDLVATACFNVRLSAPNSSISALMEWRSSETDTTGNTSISRQPARTTTWKQPMRLGFPAGPRSRQQIKTAGSASASQRMLSRNSMVDRLSTVNTLLMLSYRVHRYNNQQKHSTVTHNGQIAPRKLWTRDSAKMWHARFQHLRFARP